MEYDSSYKDSKHFQEKRDSVRDTVHCQLMRSQRNRWVKQAVPIEYDGVIHLIKTKFLADFKVSPKTFKKAIKDGELRGKIIKLADKSDPKIINLLKERYS